MAAAYVQSNQSFTSTGANSWNLAFSSNITSGNLIVVAISGIPWMTLLQYTVSDTLGTTYHIAVTNTATIGGSPFITTVFYGVAPSGGANTVNATYPTTSGGDTNYTRFSLHEYSGVDSVDKYTSATGNGSTLNAGNMTTTQADEVIFGSLVSNAGISAAGSGYTQRTNPGSELTEDMIVTSTGTYSPTATGASADDWVALGVAFGNGFTPGGGGPDPDPPVDTTPIVADIGPTTSGTTVNVGGDMVIDTPENHGAKRDGRMVQGTYTASGHIFTLDSAVPVDMQFTSADEGKVFVLRNPTASATTTVTTVDSVTDATHCVLTTGPGSNYAKTFAVLGTDDTASVAAAVSYATSYARGLGLNSAKVVLTAGIYMLAAPTIKSGDNLGNAQIPLPVIPPGLNSKFALEISGPVDAASTQHWSQTTPNLTGAVLFSALLSQSSDGTYGNPSIIGGPTLAALSNIGFPTGWDNSNGNLWSDVHVILRNFMVATPVNTSYGGFDLRCVANASIDGVAFHPFDSAHNFAVFGSGNINSGQVAVYMPSLNNNDYCEIGALTIYGWGYGLAVTDHVNIMSIRAIFCNSGILIAGPNASNALYHGWHADYISAEGCNVGLDASLITTLDDNIPSFPTTIDLMDNEVIGQYDIKDPKNFLTGYVWLGNINDSGVPKINGAGNLQVTNIFTRRGPATAPSIPSSGNDLTNPFWRDAAVTITGTQITDIEVAGESLGITMGTVIVPSGKKIQLTYSGGGSAPAWTWILM